MSREKSRQVFVEALMQSGREVSRVSLLFRHCVAEAIALHVTDAECIDYLLEAGSATAGQLAIMTGLTSGVNQTNSLMLAPLQSVLANKEHNGQGLSLSIVPQIP